MDDWASNSSIEKHDRNLCVNAEKSRNLVYL